MGLWPRGCCGIRRVRSNNGWDGGEGGVHVSMYLQVIEQLCVVFVTEGTHSLPQSYRYATAMDRRLVLELQDAHSGYVP